VIRSIFCSYSKNASFELSELAVSTHGKKADLRKQKKRQFAHGVSGNPGGRPKDEAQFAKLWHSCTLKAIETLVYTMRHGSNERVRGTAAQALLDRGWVRAKVEVMADCAGFYLEALRLSNKQIATSQPAT
jgi:hypothetical protein